MDGWIPVETVGVGVWHDMYAAGQSRALVAAARVSGDGRQGARYPTRHRTSSTRGQLLRGPGRLNGTPLLYSSSPPSRITPFLIIPGVWLTAFYRATTYATSRYR